MLHASVQLGLFQTKKTEHYIMVIGVAIVYARFVRKNVVYHTESNAIHVSMYTHTHVNNHNNNDIVYVLCFRQRFITRI